MDKLYLETGKRFPELLAFTASILVFAIGCNLGWRTQAVWLNRAGSLIIVAGVLLAASRFHERMVAKVLKHAEDNLENDEAKFKSALSKTVPADMVEQWISDPDFAQIKAAAIAEARSEWSLSFLEPAKRRIKSAEICLVVGGTLLNGFGDFIIDSVKAAMG
jgi:hypothetical protein